MKWSKYNRLIKSQNNYLLYNSLSNSFAELDSDTYYSLKQFAPGDEIKNIDESLSFELSRIKSIVTSDDIELAKIRYATLKHRFSNGKLLLTINPTLDCNFRCPYCFEGVHNKKLVMSESTENKIVSFIKASGKKRVDITWFGGEPLMGYESINRLTKKILELDILYNASMITNGYLLSDKIIQSLHALKIQSLQITLDGHADIHDSRRCLKNGGKTFDRIIKNIKRVNELSPKTKINIRVNLDKTNIDSFPALYEFLHSLNCNNLAIFPAFVNDSTEDEANPCVCNDIEQSMFLIRLFREKGLILYPFYPSSLRLECAVRNINAIVIGPEGELYKCWQDVGNVDKIYGNISGIVTNEAVLLDYLMAGDPFDDKECKACILLPICTGGCPYERIKREKNCGVKNPCMLLKHSLDEFLILHYKSKYNCE